MSVLKINLLNIIKQLNSIEDFNNLCQCDKYIFNMCKYYRNTICKHFLYKYNVLYHNVTDFIYIINNTYKDSYIISEKDGYIEYDYKGLYLLYYKYYKHTSIYCNNQRISSIPSYPNLRRLNCSENNLFSLPDYPNLITLHCHDNFLKTLPAYPKLEFLNCTDNYITTLPSYPYLYYLIKIIFYLH